MLEKFEVYIIFSQVRNKFYIGQTSNFKLRIIRHNTGLVRSTKTGIPWELVFKFEVSSRKEAIILERKIKKRGAKRYLEDNNIKFGM